MEGRGLQKERSGVVVSDKMAKTVVVSIERTVIHPRSGRNAGAIRQVEDRDETNQCHVGDRVLLVECRPLSRDKRWRVSKILEKTESVAGIAIG